MPIRLLMYMVEIWRQVLKGVSNEEIKRKVRGCKKMLQSGMDIETIVSITEFAVEEIEKLKVSK